MATDEEVKSHQRLLYAAIDDIGEAVRGNDAKAYAALVLHGLILAGLTTLVTSLGSVYQHAELAERILGLALLEARRHSQARVESDRLRLSLSTV
jgi:hypothetical protein